MKSLKSIKFLKVLFIHLVQAILYYPGFYCSLSDEKQRNGSIFRIKMKILEFYDNYGQKSNIM